MTSSRLYGLIAVIITASLFRLLPHPPNFTPILALALFSGAQFANRKLALLIPLLAMLLSDLILGLHASLVFVYLAIVLIVLLGCYLQGRQKPLNIVLAALVSSSIFFLISNFGAWLTLPQFYARSAVGLLQAYIAALPFYQYTLLSTLLFSLLLFSGWFLLQRSLSKPVQTMM